MCSNNKKQFMTHLNTVYKAETKYLAEYNFLRLRRKMGQKIFYGH
jgi:hypothetical protein